jgi:hypothetical protein
MIDMEIPTDLEIGTARTGVREFEEIKRRLRFYGSEACASSFI